MATAHRDGLSDSPEHYYENVDRNNIQGSIIFSNPDLASTIDQQNLSKIPLKFFQPMEMDSLTAETIAGLTTEEDPNLPELNPRHILSVFIGSGISHSQVKMLGILLGLQMPEPEPTTTHPEMYAMETVKKWVDSEPLPLKDAHKKLSSKLKDIELDSLIPCLRGKQRYTAVDPKKVIEFLAKETKDFTIEQAYKFGQCFNMDKVKIDMIARSAQSQRGRDLVILIFNTIDRKSSCLPESIVDQIVDALLTATEMHRADAGHDSNDDDDDDDDDKKYALRSPLSVTSISQITPTKQIKFQMDDVRDHQPIVTQSHITRAGTTTPDETEEPQSVENDQQSSTETTAMSYESQRVTSTAMISSDSNDCLSEEVTQPKQAKKKKLRNTILAYGSLVIIVCSSIIVTICLLGLPRLPSLPKQVIVPSDVVLYTIPRSYWINTISIELEGPTSCSADVISVKCNDVQYFNDSVSIYDEFDYLYIEKDSPVKFKLAENANFGLPAQTTCTPYYAWIFTSIQDAKRNSGNYFKNLSCGHPPDDTWCIELSNNEPFMPPYSSYFYIRCDRGPNCTLVDSIEVNTREYDFESTWEHKIDNVTIRSQEEKHYIKIQSNQFNLARGTDACLLLELHESCTNGDPPIYQMAIVGVNRQYGPAIVSGLIILLTTTILLSICGVHHRERLANKAKTFLSI